MSCERIQPLLSCYHDDTLSIDERAAVRAHLAACPACHAVLAAYENMFAALRAASAPVPSDLRRNVYTRIAEIEARRVGFPFGTAMLGALRTAGTTAGLLAVLAALVTAFVHLNSPQAANGPAAASPPPALSTEAAQFVPQDPDSVGAARPLSAAAEKLLLSHKADLSAGALFKVVSVRHSGASVSVEGELMMRPHAGSMPRSIIPTRLKLTASHGAVVSQVAEGTPSPIPSLPPNLGLAYLRVDSDCPFFACGNARDARVEWQLLDGQGQPLAGAGPRVVATPVAPVQMFTGLNASFDANTLAFTAMSPQPELSGVFDVAGSRSGPVQVWALRDRDLPNHGTAHRYVQQVYPLQDGRMLFDVVDALHATVAVTAQRGLRILTHIDMPTYDDVVSPDGRRIAWTYRPHGRFGTLQVANLGTQPMTRTIFALGYHPVWSPSGRDLLFIGEQRSTGPVGLYLWSDADNSVRLLMSTNARNDPFISNVAWAPGSRYFAVVLTSSGASGTSQVLLGDIQTGAFWKSFDRQWITAITWAHMSAVGAAPAPVRSGTPVTLTPGAASSTTPTSRPAATLAPARAWARDAAALLRSFYNAINARAFGRAYAYLAKNSGQTAAAFAKGYADTRHDTILKLLPAPYLDASNYHARTCVGIELIANHWAGKPVTYGGWYMVESTAGQNPAFSGWRIQMAGTRIKEGSGAVVPTMAACMAAARSAPAA